MYYIKEFTPEYIEQIKERVSKVNILRDYNNFEVELDVRWIGELGEETLVYYLEEKGMIKGEDFKRVSGDNNTLPYDFVIDDLKLDVKTSRTKYYPKPEYGCNIEVKQYNKVGCNSYLFARFLEDKSQIILLGWILKGEFDFKKRLRKKGDIVNKLEVWQDFYEVPISCLKPLTSLL